MNRLRAIALVLVMMPTVAFATEDSFAAIREKILARQHKEAREQLIKMRDGFIAQSDPANEAITWLLLGIADTGLENNVAARAEIEHAATKFVALEDHFSAAVALVSLAAFDRSEGRWTDAMATFERVLAMLRKAAEPTSRFSMNTLKAIGPTSGLAFDMVGPLMSYPEMFKPIILQGMEFLTRDEYSSVLMEVGELEKAETQLTLASKSMPVYGGLFDATIAARFGDLRRRQWRLDEAREYYVKALRGNEMMRIFIGETGEDLSILGKLAELEILTGRVDEALAWNERALTQVRKAKNARRERAILNDRAGLLHSAGRYNEALALYADVLALAIDSGDVFREASVHADLGTLYLFRGDFGSSARHLEKSIALYQGLDQQYVEAPLWILLAQVQWQLDLYDDTSSSLDNACELANRTGFRLVTAMVDIMNDAKAAMMGGSIEEAAVVFERVFQSPEVKALLMGKVSAQTLRDPVGRLGEFPAAANAHGELPMLQAMPLFYRGKALFDRGDRAGARAVWQRALATNPSSDIRAALLGMVGASYWVDGRREEGIQSIAQAAKVIDVSADNIKVEEMVAGYFGGSRRLYYNVLIELLVQERRTDEAFAHAERARTRAFLQMIGNHRLNTAHSAESHLVREAESLRTEIIEREREAELAYGQNAVRLKADLDRARQRYRTVLTRVKVTNPEYESITNVEPLRMEDVRRELDSETTLISYFVSPPTVHAWVLDRRAARYVTLPVDQETMKRIICWAAQFGPAAVDARGVRLLGACESDATSEEAFDRLIAPLLESIRHRKLVIVPHGVLHYVPFAALRNRHTQRYLIDDYTITYAPSASALRFLRAKESPIHGRALILGDPDSAMGKLPGAAEEATGIARTLGVTSLLGAAARESLLYDAQGKYDLVHLAAHGIYDPKNPLFSRIALTKDDTNDGSLTVDEVLSSLDLSGVNLVVLSACQSAIGARSGGDEVVGLTRALLYAGTPGVISTLWNIDDAASAGLMQEFYRRLAAGASAADALRQAQLAIKSNQRYADPRYWAAFSLTGDPQGRWARRSEH